MAGASYSSFSAALLRDITVWAFGLSWLEVTVSASVLLVLFVLIDSVRSWHRLSHIPGPFWASVSKFWMVRQSMKGQQPYAIQAANEKYGSLVRIGPNELATDDPLVLRRMMDSRSAYTRGPWYNALRFEPGKDNLFSMRNEVTHMKLRNKMAAVNEHIARFIKLLEAKYLSSAENGTYSYCQVDIAQKIQFFTLDVISDLAFGQPFGFIEQDKDMFDFIQITRAYFPVAILMANLPIVVAMLHYPFFRGSLPKESDKIGFGAFIGVANKKVAERFGADASPYADMLGSFIRNGLNQEEAQRESLLNVVAGSDTSATTIRIIMLCLLGNPAAYRKLQQEIDSGIRQGHISSPISDAEARQLPYLQAVIKEGLRMKAPAAGPLFKQVPPQGDTINGMFVPGGTQIGTSPFGVYHSCKTFGPDAALFVPERWLAASPTQFAHMASVVDLVFSSGKYQCLGKPVAFMELNKIFVELLRRFDFAPARPEHPAQIFNAGIWLIEDFPVRITKRDSVL